MLPSKDSLVDCIVFLLMGVVLGYGFWGAGERPKIHSDSEFKINVEKINAMQGEIGGLKREVEKQRQANYRMKSEYSKKIAGLEMKKKAEKLSETAKAKLNILHHKNLGIDKLRLKPDALIDETGKIDEGSTIIKDHHVDANVMKETPALVGTGWLAGRIAYPDMKIVFVDSWPPSKKKYVAGQIPGSAYMGISGLMQAIGNGSMPPDKVLYERMMSDLGIRHGDHVVLYGVAGMNDFTLAAYWLMDYFGHSRLSYLNGGLTKWNKEQRPVMTGFSKPVSSNYKAGVPVESVRITAAEVLTSLDDPNTVLLDTRGAGEYSGEINKVKNKRVGHIPGAIDLHYYTTNFKQDDGTVKFVADLKTAYEAKGVTKNKKIIVYCQEGVRAASTYFILKYVLGYPDVRNYIGSWNEWGNRVDFSKYPVEVSSLKYVQLKSVKDAGTKYVGVNKCKSCHKKEYKSWKRTKMAVSFESLKPGVKAAEKIKVGLNHKMDFTKDPECLACHTTGYGKPGGFVSIEETPDMANVQCEECHGAGGGYSAVMKKNNHFKLSEVIEAGLVIPSHDKEGCLRCHDNKNPFNEKVDAKYRFDFIERIGKTHEHFTLKYEH